MSTRIPPAAYDHAYALVRLLLGPTDHVLELALIVHPSPRITISVGIEPDEEGPTLLLRDGN